jgi:hypothetical protein
VADFRLACLVVTLPELTAPAGTDQLVNLGNGRPAQIITDTLSSRLLVLGRDSLQLMYLSPHALPSPYGSPSPNSRTD